MKAEEKPVIERAADKVNDAVEAITLKVADSAVEPDAEHAAGTTNEQVYIPEAAENVSLPSHIDPKSDDRIARERQKTSTNCRPGGRPDEEAQGSAKSGYDPTSRILHYLRTGY